jgi:indoleamine 2,3-dioxygenase
MPVQLSQYPKPQSLCKLENINLADGRGFLPAVDPILTSEQSGFQVLVKLAAKIPELLTRKRMVSTLNEMLQLPELADDCDNLPLLERIYSMVVSIVHAYIIEKGGNRDTNKKPVVIPEKIAFWLNRAAKMLGRYPTQTYETYILQNYRLVNPEAGYSLENLVPLVTYTNSIGEAWFIAMHVVSEYLGGRVLMHYAMLQNLFDQPSDSQNNILFDALKNMNIEMRALNSHLNKMCNGISGFDFFFKLRPYLKSWEPGVVMQGVPEYRDRPIEWRGASGAQSSITPALDRILQLGISQLDTMRDMVHYMSPSHQALLSGLDNPVIDIRALTQASHNETLVSAYNDLVNSTVAFRQIHYSFIIDTYVLKNLVGIFSKSIIASLNRKMPQQSASWPLGFINDLLHQLFTVTKANIVHRTLGYLLERDHAGELDAILDSTQPVLKEMLSKSCDSLAVNGTSLNLEDVFSKLHCDVLVSVVNEHKFDHLLTAEHVDVLSNLLDVLHKNHKILLSKTLGTGRTDFTYFLQNNIEQNKAAALPLPGEAYSNIKSVFTRAGPSLLVGAVSGFSNTLCSRLGSEKHSQVASMIASSATMWALDYSTSNIATFVAFRLILQGFDFPKQYIQYMSWAIMLLTCITDLDPKRMMINMLINMMANVGGEKIGHYTAEKALNNLIFLG